MKIGFIYEHSFATNNGSNHLLGVTLKRMLAEGHEVFLFQSSFEDNIENDYPREFNCPSFKYIPIKQEKVSKTSFIKRYLNGIKFANKLKKVIKNYKLDMFFVQSSPTVVYTVRKLKKLKTPIVYNIHDVFPGSAYALGIVKSKILDFLFRKIQQYVYKNVNKIIVVSDDMKEILIKEKVKDNKIEIVQTWFDSDNICIIEEKENTFVKENNIDCNKVIIQYAGNVGQVFGLEEFSKLVNSLKGNDNIEFHIIGSGAKLDTLKNLTKGANIRFFDWQPQERMSEIYSYPDFEIIPLRLGVIGNNVPSKMALAMACGKPIINIVEKSHYYDLFEPNGCGYSFEQTKMDDLACLISSFTKEDFKDKKENIISFNNQMYSMKKNTDRLMEIINNIYSGEKND